MPTPEEFRQLIAQILGPEKSNAITGVVNAQQLADQKGWSYDQAKSQMRDRREYASRRKGLLRELQGMGYSLEDMGFQNKHEEGASAFAKYGKGGFATNYGTAADGSFEYDWAGGRKRNVKTSDVTARDRWVPISEREYQSKAEAENLKAQGYDTFAEQQQYRMGNTSGQQMPLNVQSLQQKYGVGGSGGGGGSFSTMGGQGFAAAGNGLPGSYQTMGGLPQTGYGPPAPGTTSQTGYIPPSYAGGPPLGSGTVSQMDPYLQQMAKNDILQQQIGIQKQLEGHAMGKPIYDYMLNEIYGPILGVNFNSGQQAASQYGQAVTGAQQTAPVGGKPASQPGSGAISQGGTSSGLAGTGSSVATGGFMGGQSTQQVPGEVSKKASATPGNGTMAPAVVRNDVQTFGAPPQAGQVTTQAGTGNPMQQGGGDPLGHRLITIPTANGTALYDPASGRYFQNYAEYTQSTSAQAGQLAGAPGGVDPDWKEQIQKAEETRKQLGLEPGIVWGNTYTGNAYNPGGVQYSGSNAVGTPLPTGGYSTGAGANSMDPNLNKTWARFLAPTYNKVAQLTDQQLNEIRSSMPRGGGQDKAVSNAIQNKYSTIASGWQSLVPGAMQGIEGIGREMYFQQPMGNSGAAGIAEGARQANQNYNLSLQQMKANQEAQDKESKSKFWSGVGTIAGGVVGGAVGSVVPVVGTAGGAAIGASAGGMLGGSLSDARAKKDVQPFSAGLKELRKLDPVSYKYNGKAGSQDNQPGISVMAQQLEKVIPEAVEKKDTPDGPYRFISPLTLQMTTINAIKELDKKISSMGRK